MPRSAGTITDGWLVDGTGFCWGRNIGSGRLQIPPFEDCNVDAVVGLSLRALGSGNFRRQHPDWRMAQRRAGEEVCAAGKGRVWVAEVGAGVVDFVAIKLHHPESGMGEISMPAVDPDYQGGGIGTALTEFAPDRLTDAGMTMAMVETGGGPGHAAARRTYEKASYVHGPVAATSRTCRRESR